MRLWRILRKYVAVKKLNQLAKKSRPQKEGGLKHYEIVLTISKSVSSIDCRSLHRTVHSCRA